MAEKVYKMKYLKNVLNAFWGSIKVRNLEFRKLLKGLKY